MNRDDVIRMAREAGFGALPESNANIADILERFAALVAAAEREACARVCEEHMKTLDGPWQIPALECADAIRARGEP